MIPYKYPRAFSILELLVVVAIVATIAAFLFPVLNQSKKEAIITDDLNRLHQCQVATSLYQHDNDSAGVPPFNLPLPPDWLNTFKGGAPFYGTSQSTWMSSCGWHPTSNSPNFAFFAGIGPEITRTYSINGEQTILLADNNCNDSEVDVRADFVTKLGLGVLIDGTLERRLHQGNVYSLKFWNEVPK